MSNLEIREGRYYLAGTRVGLNVLVQDFRAGKSPEAILQAYPSIGSLAKVMAQSRFFWSIRRQLNLIWLNRTRSGISFERNIRSRTKYKTASADPERTRVKTRFSFMPGTARLSSMVDGLRGHSAVHRLVASDS